MSPVPFKNWASLISPTHSLLNILVFFFTLYFVCQKHQFWRKVLGKKLNPCCVYFSIITVFCGARGERIECPIWHRQEVLRPDSCQFFLRGFGLGGVSSCVGLGAFSVLTTPRGYQHHHGLPSRQSFKFSTLAPNLGFSFVPDGH